MTFCCYYKTFSFLQSIKSISGVRYIAIIDYSFVFVVFIISVIREWRNQWRENLEE